MADWDDVRRLAAGLPEVVEQRSRDGRLEWRVRGRSVVWERPLRRSDLAALGSQAPEGPVLGAHVADEGVKAAWVADEPAVFTTPHFDGYPAVLVELDRVGVPELAELVTEAWRCRAPKRLVASWDASAPPPA